MIDNVLTYDPNDDRAIIAGVRIDGLALKAVVHEIMARAINRSRPSYVVTPNVQHIVMLQKDKAFREIYRRAFLAVPDGVPLLWAANLLGTKIPERVNGTDLFEAICDAAAERGLRIFLLGGREGAAVAAADKLRVRFPHLVICGTYCPPFGFHEDAVEDAKAVAAVRAAKPDILFVGLGAPKQEFWMSAHLDDLMVPISLGIGNSFEFVAGIVPRAPVWMQRAGLEWLHRLCAEPRRLWKRYIFGNAQFCSLIAQQYVAQSLATRTQSAENQLIPEVAHIRFRRRYILEPWHLLADVLNVSKLKQK